MEIWKNSVIVESKEIVYPPILFISICNLWLLSPSNDYEFYKAFLMAKKIWVIIYDTGQDVFPLLKYSHSKNSYWVCGKSPDMYLNAKTESYVLGCLCTLGYIFWFVIPLLCLGDISTDPSHSSDPSHSTARLCSHRLKCAPRSSGIKCCWIHYYYIYFILIFANRNTLTGGI